MVQGSQGFQGAVGPGLEALEPYFDADFGALRPAKPANRQGQDKDQTGKTAGLPVRQLRPAQPTSRAQGASGGPGGPRGAVGPRYRTSLPSQEGIVSISNDTARMSQMVKFKKQI